MDYYDFVLSRAVAPLPELVMWAKPLINKNYNHDVKNGLICLKGGDLREERASTPQKAKVIDIQTWFQEAYFETKKLVHVPLI